MPKLSKRGTELPTSPIRKLVVYSDQAKSKGIEVLKNTKIKHLMTYILTSPGVL